MKKLPVAIALLLPLAACGGPDPVQWQTPPATVSSAPPASTLPSGLDAYLDDGDEAELRVYDATDGTLLRSFPIPAGEDKTFSPTFAWAAEIKSNTLIVYALSGDAYARKARLTPEALNVKDLTLQTVAFIPGTTLLAVEVDGGDGITHKTISLDPADPENTIHDFAGIPFSWDSHADPVETAYVPIPALPQAEDVVIRRSARELVQADILEDDDPLYTCTGPELAPFTLACRGQGSTAVLAALTADPAKNVATLRVIGKAKGKPFTAVHVSPDRNTLLAQRADGFYSVPVTGGKPELQFDALPRSKDLTVLSWN